MYGANDERLMDANKNIYHIASGKDESYIKIEFDLSPLKDGRNAWVHIYRAGYRPDDKPSVPLKSFMLPADVLMRRINISRIRSLCIPIWVSPH